MKRVMLLFIVLLVVASAAQAATQQAIQQAIDKGLAYLASTQSTSGTEGYWNYNNNGTLAATASAALAFIEEGYLPGDGSVYDGTVTKAVNYVFNRANTENLPWEASGFLHHAEDYNGDGVLNDGGNGTGLWFKPTSNQRDIYTNGIVTPMVYALGKAKGMNTTIGIGSGAIAGLTYKQAMQDVADWFAWGQVEPSQGVYRGGWRYTSNYGSSDNSTAQWGALPFLYADSLGLGVAPHVRTELELWTDRIQNPLDAGIDWKDGGSGYTSNTEYVNMSKTGGMLLQFAVEGKAIGHPDVQAALYYMDSMESFDHWYQEITSWPDQWEGGNLGSAYAMWAAYKGLSTYGGIVWNNNGTADPDDDFMVGNTSLISTAPGGITIGQDWDPKTSVAGDWYSQYCDYLVSHQYANGSWPSDPWGYWYGGLATGWYVNILNATGAPEPIVPVPAAVLLGGLGLSVAGWRLRRRQEM